MSIARARIEQARPLILAQKARELVRREIAKGCQPDLARQPVALEPAFEPLILARDRLAAICGPPMLPEHPPSLDDVVRRQVWISPDQKFDWRRSELFLRQICSVAHRVGLEITGNQEQILITILCHRADWAVVSAAFYGGFERCELSMPLADPLSTMPPGAWDELALYDYFPPPPYSHLLTRPEELHVSPFEPLITAISGLPADALGIYQALFQPVPATHDWHRNVQILLDLEYAIKLMDGLQLPQRYAQEGPSGDRHHMAGQVETKAHNDRPFYALALRVAVVGAGERGAQLLRSVATFGNLFQHGGRPLNHLTEAEYASVLSREQLREMFLLGLTYRPGFIVNSWELAGPVHIPPTQFMEQRRIAFETLETLPIRGAALAEGTRIGTCNYAGRAIPVHIPHRLRGRHTHLIGRSDMGKSSTMERMILDDLAKGFGVAVLDPHGDLVERLLGLLPEHEIERIIYFNPGDRDWVPLWNPLQPISGQDIGRTADDLVGAFKSFVIHWGDRLEHLLRHAFFAFLHLPGSTFLDVANILQNKSPYAERMRGVFLDAIDNEVARRFWLYDFKNYGKDDLGPPRNKLSKLLVNQTVSLMLSQPDCAFNFRDVMDKGMIFLADLSSVGSEVREVLGCLMLSLLHQTAISRSDTMPAKRRPFRVYCDEAHRFMTDALEDLIAETRKYQVGLTLAHQYMKQFGSRKTDALSSMGATVIFNVNTKDARHLVDDLRGLVDIEDLITLELGEAILRADTEVVRVATFVPPDIPEENCRERIIAESRRRYYKPAHSVREAIRRRCGPWSGSCGIPPSPTSGVADGVVEQLTYDVFP